MTYTLDTWQYPFQWRAVPQARTPEGFELHDWSYAMPNRVPVCWAQFQGRFPGWST